MRFQLMVLAALLLTCCTARGQSPEKMVTVRDAAEFAQMVKKAKPGWQIRVAPGNYSVRLSVDALHGTKQNPIVIEAADPEKPPRLIGGPEAFHIRRSSYLVLRNLDITGQTRNGLNIDDGGHVETPSHHIFLDGVHVTDIGARGNHDAIKLSGVENFVLRDCLVEGCGGQGIDMVGCHRALIEACLIRGKKGYSQKAGIQMKGGTSLVTVRQCVFLKAGSRAVNLGGSTGLKFFRPKDAAYEAKDLTVEGCIFVGSEAPLAFTGVDGALVQYNTFYLPDKWLMRILQEHTERRFVPCRNGRFEHNLIYYNSKQLKSMANVGPNTQPETFVFADNLWFCSDNPKLGQVSLPTKERNGQYGIDPDFVDAKQLNLQPRAQRAKAFGAHAFGKKADSKTDNRKSQ